MKKEQEPIFIEILSYFIDSQNCLFEGLIKESNEYYKKGENLFKQHFSERPESEIIEIYNCSRTLYSRYTHTTYMSTYTGRREMWKSLLNEK